MKCSPARGCSSLSPEGLGKGFTERGAFKRRELGFPGSVRFCSAEQVGGGRSGGRNSTNKGPEAGTRRPIGAASHWRTPSVATPRPWRMGPGRWGHGGHRRPLSTGRAVLKAEVKLLPAAGHDSHTRAPMEFRVGWGGSRVTRDHHLLREGSLPGEERQTRQTVCNHRA